MSDDNCDMPEFERGSVMDELARVIRYSTAALGGYLVAKGYASQATVELVTGIAVSATPLIVGMALARFQRKKMSNVIQTLKSNQRKPVEPSDGE